MSQVPQNLPPAPIYANLPKENLARSTTTCKNLQVALEDSDSDIDLTVTK